MKFRIALIVTLLAVATVGSTSAQAEDVGPSARVRSAVLVRSGPSTETPVLDRLRPGDAATLVAEETGWYEVELPDGRHGFVAKSWTVILTSVGSTTEALTTNTYKVHVIDVGTGLAVFVEGKDFALLYDAGSQDDLHEGDENRVVAYIKAVHPGLTKLDHVVLSHPHKDHLQLMPAVFDQFRVSNVWESGRVNKTDGYCHFLKAVMAEPGVKYHDAIASNSTRNVSFSGSGCNGTVIVREAGAMDATPVSLGAGASMTMLYRDPANYADPNGNSVVVRLDLGSKRILLAGDAEGGDRESPSNPPAAGSIEAKLLACCAAALRADALVVGHHGSLTSSRDSFLDAVSASLFAISSGPFPYKSVRLPDDEIVADLEHRGQVFRTDRDDLLRIGDEARSCELNPHKIGPDADETPGGCNNIVMIVNSSGPISASYSDLSD